MASGNTESNRIPLSEVAVKLRDLSIALKIYLMSAIVFVLIAGSMLFLISTISASAELTRIQSSAIGEQTKILEEQSSLLRQQAVIVEQRRLVNAVIMSFSELRYWLYDLQVSWLNESETSAEAARERLAGLLAQLATSAPEVVEGMKPKVATFNEKMLAAVDAYVDSNRVLGNSLVAEARTQGTVIDKDLAALLQSTSEKAVTISNQVADIGQRVRGAGQQVGEAASNVQEKNQSLTRGAWIVLLLVSLILAGFGFLLINSISAPIRTLNQAINQIERDSDLSLRIPVLARDEIGATASAINAMLEKFEQLIQEVAISAMKVANAAHDTAMNMEHTAQGLSEQQLETDQVSTAITEMSHTVHDVARNAESAAAAADKANHDAHLGQDVVELSVKAINSLAEEVNSAGAVINRVASDSSNIGHVLDVIRGVSDQTNLLALNAAIEAARAGEAGRGFAVVADEVRVLAQKTQESAREIQGMIQRLQSSAMEAVSAMEHGVSKAEAGVTQAAKAGDALHAILGSVQTITDLNMQIASAEEEQAAVAETISRNVMHIRDVAESTTEAAAKTVVACEELARLANTLQGLVSKFKAR